MNLEKLKAVSPSLVGELQAARARIAVHVSEGCATLHPAGGLPAGRAAAQSAECLRLLRLCQDSPDEHVRQLCAALALGDLRPFTAYVDWLSSVQGHRGLPTDPIIDALTLIREWIGSCLRHRQAATAIAVIDHGIARLQRTEAASLTGPQSLQPLAGPVGDYARALLDGRRDTAVDRVLAAMGQGASLVDVSVDLVQPALYEIGRLWEHNRIGVAQEHLATAVTQNALAAGFARATFAPPNGRRAAFACVAGNHHGIGLRMVSDAFEVAGWDVDFLGNDTPTASIVNFVCEHGPDLLGLSAGLVHQVITLREVIGQVRAELGNAAPDIIIGGLPFASLGCSSLGTGADDCFTDARAAVAAASEPARIGR
jgi:methanogenic corrinoid protein MtbC1